MNCGVILFLVGIYFTPQVTSFLVKRGVRHGQRVSTDKHEIKHNIQENNISEARKTIVEEPKVQSVGHSKHKTELFASEPLLNTNLEGRENDMLLRPNTNTSNNKHVNTYEKEEETEEYSVEDTADIPVKEDPRGKLKSQFYESEDQPSGDGLTSGEFFEQHARSLGDLNIQNTQLIEDNNKGHMNIPEEVINEDLKQVLNVTFDRNMSGEHFLNNTYKGLTLGEPNFSNMSVSMPNSGTTKDDDQHSISEQIGYMQEERSQGENITEQSQRSTDGETYKMTDEMPEDDKNIENGQIENITNKMNTFPKSHDTSEILLSHELTVDHYNNSLDSATKKEIKTNLTIDPCTDFHCKRGKTCKTEEEGKPICTCQDPDLCQPTNINDRVCGTDNKTYSSDCHFFATKCHLEGTKEGNHLHLDYQGPCKYIPPCTDYELAHFPFRMRDWLKNVLVQLYERGLENPGPLSQKQRIKVKKIYENEKRLQDGDHNIELLVKDFQKNYHMYVYPVHWKFNQLDNHSMDRLLTRSELSALRAPLIPLEHCVTAFLQGCNSNNDKHISLQEWCHCFGIKDGDIDEDLLF